MTLLESTQSTMSDPEVASWSGVTVAAWTDALSCREVMTGRDASTPPAPNRQRSASSPLVALVLADQGALVTNWDGHGAPAPELTAIRVAQTFLDALPSGPPPAISASAAGGVLLEWERDDVELLLEVKNDRNVHALVTWPDGREFEGPVATLKEPVLDALAALIARV